MMDLLETNLRQRGIGNTNPIKLARCGVELERIYNIYKGFNGWNKTNKEDNPPYMTQEKIANELGIGQKHYQNLKKILTLIPEIQDLVSDDKLSPTIAHKVYAKLSKEEPSQGKTIREKHRLKALF